MEAAVAAYCTFLVATPPFPPIIYPMPPHPSSLAQVAAATRSLHRIVHNLFVKIFVVITLTFLIHKGHSVFLYNFFNYFHVLFYGFVHRSREICRIVRGSLSSSLPALSSKIAAASNQPVALVGRPDRERERRERCLQAGSHQKILFSEEGKKRSGETRVRPIFLGGGASCVSALRIDICGPPPPLSLSACVRILFPRRAEKCIFFPYSSSPFSLQMISRPNGRKREGSFDFADEKGFFANFERRRQ